MGRRVLVVDDHPEMIGLVTDALTGAGHTVISAPDGEQALAAVESEQPDLVILDIAMPVMTGLQVLGVLRSRPETRHLPVVVLTVRDSHGDALASWMGGADRFLTKPCSMAELLATVEEMLAAPKRR